MSQWGAPNTENASASPPTNTLLKKQFRRSLTGSPSPQQTPERPASSPPETPSPLLSRARGGSRAQKLNGMTQKSPQHEAVEDTPPELQPIFSYLNSHSNKLYQEGYFLKLHDLDSRGRPSPDRSWVECFAQLVGTVLSLWDAAALDRAGQEGEVMPTFINLSDANIRMIESLPMSGSSNLQNVLMVTTAANNRYLLHFNSVNSLTQWTAGIRLAMFENTALQEAYTGSLLAGKGKVLNNIKNIMQRSRFPHEDWARVRFGAGTPWRRCWCVVTPPSEKEYAKAQKTLKKSAYDRKVVMPTGHVKFYDTRKVNKKTTPIATVTDAYAAYAIYPQSKPLINQSTLVKLEGLVTMHVSSHVPNEGYVFVMPEAHPAVPGFETMLQWLFPVFDTFNLYGRPMKLIADVLDPRGLMFAMPRDKRYGYLDTLDVISLINMPDSQKWTERQWRVELRKLTARRMLSSAESPAQMNLSRPGQRRNTTLARTPAAAAQLHEEGRNSSPASRASSFTHSNHPTLPIRTAPGRPSISPHKRSVSDAPRYVREPTTPSDISYETGPEDYGEDDSRPPTPPPHGGVLANAGAAAATELAPPEPVSSPPAFTHSPNSRPSLQLNVAPELRRAHSNVDAATLYQMQDAIRKQSTPQEDPHRPISLDVEHNPPRIYEHSHSIAGVPDYYNPPVEVHGASDAGQHRLPPIPGSPYMEREDLEMASPQQVANTQQHHMRYDEPRPQSVASPAGSSRSVKRKPLPGNLNREQG
ncbi:hypothetical protein K470DRAFT_261117 [Piedraia hortae CBS 480.64]|uniref:PH domain-containing protein n=1 Tax=Piedraia hortae CBS 480.64 TaxID=1314780 RepID=A0A6A7BP30_9PEZI|nr:hypothetical protein K470DRAFT_261117 [Piedraia hortae CBS 480.64]